MTYSEAVNYILDIPKFTKRMTRSIRSCFCNILVIHSVHYKVIHVAGTNGKGSVCAYLDGCSG